MPEYFVPPNCTAELVVATLGFSQPDGVLTNLDSYY